MMTIALEELERYSRIVEPYHKETDRAAAVLGSSYVESLLKRVLCCHFVSDQDKIDSLFNGYGPLATFSARVDLLYVLGFLPHRHQRDLNLIRKIRNHFAHHPEETNFDASPVRDWVAELSMNRMLPGANTHPRRRIYLFTIAELAILLSNLMKRIEHRTVPEYIEIKDYP